MATAPARLTVREAASPRLATARNHAPASSGRAAEAVCLTLVATGDGAGRPAGKGRPCLTPAKAKHVAERAEQFAAAHLGRLIAPDLAEAAGVSESTLRRALHAQTGQTVGQFLLATRLEQARDWLSSNRELRTQAEIVVALGFASSAVFGRAYARRFGESMTETRRRAVNASGAPKYFRSNCFDGWASMGTLSVRPGCQLQKIPNK
jgi:AraC-like DNA-binding protein